MTVAGLQGGSAKHAGVPGQGTYVLRRGACAVPAPDAAEAARHAELGPARGPVDRAHEPRRVHEGLQQHQRMMKACRPVPHQMACAQPQHPGPEIGNRAQEQEPGVVGHQMQSVVLVAQRPANPRVTRFQRRAENDASATHSPRHAAPYHSVSPTFAPPQGNDASPSEHGTAPPPRATPQLHPVPAPMQPLFKDLYRNSSRKSTPKRIRLGIQEPQSEQKSALVLLESPVAHERS